MDTGQLILQTYGLQALRVATYKPGINATIANSKVSSDANPYTKMAAIEKDKPLYKSALKTPVFCNFEIQGGTWTNEDGVTVHEWPDITFDTVLMSVDQRKLIIKTIIQGRNGSVKEYISDGDYDVNIKLLIIGSPGVMPLTAVGDLKKALDAPVALTVFSRYLQNLGVNNIVVDEYSMPQIEGNYNTQMVEIRASSDVPIELKIK